MYNSPVDCIDCQGVHVACVHRSGELTLLTANPRGFAPKVCEFTETSDANFDFRNLVQFKPNSSTQLLVKHQNLLVLFDTSSNEKKNSSKAEYPNITSSTFSRQGDKVAFTSMDGSVVFTVITNDFVFGLPQHKFSLYELINSNNKDEFATSISAHPNLPNTYCLGTSLGGIYIIDFTQKL
jgi:hypothetical protein